MYFINFNKQSVAMCFNCTIYYYFITITILSLRRNDSILIQCSNRSNTCKEKDQYLKLHENFKFI